MRRERCGGNKHSNGHRAQHVNGTARVEAHAACDFLRERGEHSASVRGGNKVRGTLGGKVKLRCANGERERRKERGRKKFNEECQNL